MKKLGSNFSYSRLLKLNYIALFFSIFLPSRLGGDVVKGYYTTKENKNLIKSSISIISDRFFGVIAFIFLNLFSIIIGYSIIPFWIVITVLLIDLAIVGVLVLSLNKNIVNKIKIIKKIFNKFSINEKINLIYKEINTIKKDKIALTTVIILSLIIDFVFILLNYSYAIILNLDISFIYFLIFIPIIMTITILPIALNGLGLREYLIIVMFQIAGLSIEQAFALGIINRFLVLVHCAIGGILNLLENIKN